MNVRRIRIERDAGADTDLEGALPRTKPEFFDHFMFAIDECAAKNVVIEMREIGVDAAFVRFGHQLTPFPRNPIERRAQPNGSLRQAPSATAASVIQAAALTPRICLLNRAMSRLRKRHCRPF